jgi:murein DD-endopeptidase MepM/ murein hydrolase activator NlpD
LRRERGHIVADMRRISILLGFLVLMMLPAPAHAAGTWVWPVVGPVIVGYDPPDDPYGSGHRGIDIAAPVGTPVRAVDAGIVTFAGTVGGQLFVTVDHGGGLASTYSWLAEVRVRKNDVVARGQVIALSGTGHPGSSAPHLHLGAKLDGSYADPMDYLGPASVAGLIRLAPLATPPPA